VKITVQVVAKVVKEGVSERGGSQTSVGRVVDEYRRWIRRWRWTDGLLTDGLLTEGGN
jgi:hypothetical protein